MEIRDLIAREGTLVIDPTLMHYSPDEFFAKYGSYMEAVCLVAKAEAGSAFYPSFTAPKNEKFSEFFSSFAQISSDIGIKVFAMLHSNVDLYLSRDTNFQMQQSGGFPVPGYVCPARKEYWYYLSEIAQEMSNYPIEGIILKDLTYPRIVACFCENCRREFAELNKNLKRDFSFETIDSQEWYRANWISARTKALFGMVESIVSKVHQTKQIEILPEILVDSKTNYLEGAVEHFGQNINLFSQVSSHILLHINPFSNEFPTLGSLEHEEFITKLAPLKEKQETINNSLFVWGVNEASFNFVENIKDSIGSRNIFFSKETPASLQNRRSLHLGIF